MEPETHNQRLSLISTRWTQVREALPGPEGAVPDAQREMFERYGGAIRRYLLGALRDPDAAEELFQEFAVRLVQGDLAGYDPERGRFRDFLKGVLFHLIAHYQKRCRQQPLPLGSCAVEPEVEAPSLSELDGNFRTCWRDELLAQTWAALAKVEQSTGQPFHTVLRFRADHPSMPSPQMAGELSARLGKPLKAPAVRQILHRARERFAEILLDGVAHSLKTCNVDFLEQELNNLGLLEHCRSALKRRIQTG